MAQAMNVQQDLKFPSKKRLNNFVQSSTIINNPDEFRHRNIRNVGSVVIGI